MAGNQIVTYDAEGTREVTTLPEHMILYHALDPDWDLDPPEPGVMEQQHAAEHQHAIDHRTYEGKPGAFLLHVHPRQETDNDDALKVILGEEDFHLVKKASGALREHGLLMQVSGIDDLLSAVGYQPGGHDDDDPPREPAAGLSF